MPCGTRSPERGYSATSALLRELNSVDAHVQYRRFHVARGRRAAVHNASGDNNRDDHSVDSRAAQAVLQRRWPADSSGERRVGRVAVRSGPTALGLYELQAKVLGLHTGRPTCTRMTMEDTQCDLSS